MAKKSTATAGKHTAEDKLKALSDTVAVATLIAGFFDVDATLFRDGISEFDREALRQHHDRARADVEKLLADVSQAAGGTVPAAGEQTFKAATTIDHAGRRYSEGDPISLDHASFLQLTEVSAVVGDWKE